MGWTRHLEQGPLPEWWPLALITRGFLIVHQPVILENLPAPPGNVPVHPVITKMGIEGMGRGVSHVHHTRWTHKNQ